MKFSNQIVGSVLGVIVLAATGCGILPNNSAQPTRAATQTPFIVFVPVTTTPEPATVTPLPTVTSNAPQSPTRTATSARIIAIKPTATKTKQPVAPVVTGPTATTTPTCTSDPIIPLDPGDNASVTTFVQHAGSGAFIFKWNQPANAGGDDFGYKIQMDGRTISGKPGGGDTVYISYNKFNSESQGKQFTYSGQQVWGLQRNNEDTIITWYIAAVRFTGTIDDQGHLNGKATECAGSQSTRRNIRVVVIDQSG